MKSSDLPGFSGWQKWSAEVVLKAPSHPGVYAFRLAGGVFGRFRGESDLVYIGCTESPDGTIARRLSDHLPSRAEVLDTARRFRDAQKFAELEVAWKTLGTSDQAINEEASLLRNYIWDHLELPPVNRSEPLGDTRVAIESVADFILSEKRFGCDSYEDARRLAEKVVEHLAQDQRREKA
jgi:hypothetical protein